VTPPTARVAVPTLTGLALEEARAQASAVGLQTRVQERTDGTAVPGSVLAVDPPPGTFVPVGTTITLVVAVAPPTSEPPGGTPTGASTSPGG
jgi:serine/threonine-protein kinase